LRSVSIIRGGRGRKGPLVGRGKKGEIGEKKKEASDDVLSARPAEKEKGKGKKNPPLTIAVDREKWGPRKKRQILSSSLLETPPEKKRKKGNRALD